MPNSTELIELLLRNRGIKEDDWERFLNPSYENHLYDPFLMKDMDIACVRIFEAIEAKEKIIIYSDYDCDGIPASVIMNDFFNKIGYKNFSIYIPDRHEEGYGLHHEAIEQFIKDDVKLLITFDLGITAKDEVAKATSSGIDVIITDHHLPHVAQVEAGIPQTEIPKAYAILNPKQNGCKYPDKMLCGAGIAFKLIQGLIKKYGEYWKINKGWEKWLLDMASLATLSDQVPLIDENRVISYYGMKVLRKGRRLGVYEIFKLSGVNINNLTEDDITFTLTPKINAASRMSDPFKAFMLLSTNDMKEAKALALDLSKINDDRKQTVAHIMKEVKSTLIKRMQVEEEKPIIVIGNPNWKVGVLGIVASKIVDEYKKTVFVWGLDGSGVIKGSGRAFSNVNLVEMLSLLPGGSLIDFGGHKGACGFSIKEEEIHFFEDRLISVYKDNQSKIKEEGFSFIDAQISVDDVNEDNFSVIERLAPYGVGNPKPIFLLKNIIINEAKEFGKDKNHLELSFKNSKGKIVKAIAFFKTRSDFSLDRILTKGDHIDLTASFEKNSFGGKKEIRLRINDIVVK